MNKAMSVISMGLCLGVDISSALPRSKSFRPKTPADEKRLKQAQIKRQLRIDKRLSN